MSDRMSDAEVLGQTAEWLSRLADTIERATTGLADSIAQVRAEQGELRDELYTLKRQADAEYHAYKEHLREFHGVRFEGDRR